MSSEKLMFISSFADVAMVPVGTVIPLLSSLLLQDAKPAAIATATTAIAMILIIFFIIVLF